MIYHVASNVVDNVMRPAVEHATPPVVRHVMRPEVEHVLRHRVGHVVSPVVATLGRIINATKQYKLNLGPHTPRRASGLGNRVAAVVQTSLAYATRRSRHT